MRVRNSPDMWIRANGAFEPIVERHLFDAAQAIIQNRSRRISDDEMLERLETLYQARGYLSGLIIDEADGLPSSSTYSARFGSLVARLSARRLHARSRHSLHRDQSAAPRPASPTSLTKPSPTLRSLVAGSSRTTAASCSP